MSKTTTNNILREYAATANNPEYKGNWEVIDSKFPELKEYDKQVLREYAATANNPEYKGDWNVVDSKFPELFGSSNKPLTDMDKLRLGSFPAAPMNLSLQDKPAGQFLPPAKAVQPQIYNPAQRTEDMATLYNKEVENAEAPNIRKEFVKAGESVNKGHGAQAEATAQSTDYLNNPQAQAVAQFDQIMQNPNKYVGEDLNAIFDALPEQKQLEEWKKNPETWDNRPYIQALKTAGDNEQSIFGDNWLGDASLNAGDYVQSLNSGAAGLLGGVSELMHQKFEKPLWGWMSKDPNSRQIWGRIADFFFEDQAASQSLATSAQDLTFDETGQPRQKRVFDYAVEGDIAGLADDLVNSGLQSAPTSIVAMGAGYIGMPSVGMAIIGASSYGQRKRELDQQYPDMPEWKKDMIAVPSAAVEVLSERLGSIQIGKTLAKIYGKAGYETAEIAMKNTAEAIIDNTVKNLKNPTLLKMVGKSMYEEGIKEELPASLGNYAIDVAAGLRQYDTKTMLLEGAESAIYGGFSGGVFGLIGAPGINKNKKIAKQLEGLKTEYDKANSNIQAAFADSEFEFDGEKIITLPLNQQAEILASVLQAENLTSEQKDAIQQYMQAGNGLNTALVNVGLTNIELLRKKANAVKQIENQTNEKTGTVDNITIQGSAENENYNLKSGTIILDENGKVNPQESDEAIYYFTGATNEDGTPEVNIITPENISAIQSADPKQLLQQSFMDIEAEEFIRSEFGAGMDVMLNTNMGEMPGTIVAVVPEGLVVNMQGVETVVPFKQAVQDVQVDATKEEIKAAKKTIKDFAKYTKKQYGYEKFKTDPETFISERIELLEYWNVSNQNIINNNEDEDNYDGTNKTLYEYYKKQIADNNSEIAALKEVQKSYDIVGGRKSAKKSVETKQQPTQEQPAELATRQSQVPATTYAPGTSIVVNGTTFVVGEQDENGNYAINDENGQSLDRFTPQEMADFGFSNVAVRPTQAEEQPLITEGEQETAPVTSETTPATPEAAPVQQYPITKNGEIDFDAMTVAQTYQYMVDNYGHDEANSGLSLQEKSIQGLISQNIKALDKVNASLYAQIKGAKSIQEQLKIREKNKAAITNLTAERTELDAQLAEIRSLMPKAEQTPTQPEVTATASSNVRPEEQLRREQEAERLTAEQAKVDSTEQTLTPNVDTSEQTLTPNVDTSEQTLTPEAEQQPVIEVREKKKWTGTPQWTRRINNLGDPITLEDVVLRRVAGGAKFVWSADAPHKGLSQELGFTNNPGEREARKSMIDEKNGMTPQELAHDIYESSELQFMGEVDYQDIYNAVVDTLLQVNSATAALERAEANRNKYDMMQEDYGVYTTFTQNEIDYLEQIPDEILAGYLGITNFTPEQIDFIFNKQNEYYANEQQQATANAQPADTSTSERSESIESTTSSGTSEGQQTELTQAELDTQELDAYIAEQAHNSNPTEKQKETGIYDKARISLQGHNITLETLKNEQRSGVDSNGKAWSITMNNHYGELDGTTGYDGDAIDVFVGPNPKGGQIFVIDQLTDNGAFDESKVMLGFDTAEEARAAYMSNYEAGWQGFGSITPAGDNFKAWLYDGKKQRKPFAEYKETPEAVEMKESKEASTINQRGWEVGDDFSGYGKIVSFRLDKYGKNTLAVLDNGSLATLIRDKKDEKPKEVESEKQQPKEVEPEATTPQAQIQQVLDNYNDEGQNGNGTMQEVVGNILTIAYDNDIAAIQESYKTYEAELREDREQFGERGDREAIENNFMKVVEQYMNGDQLPDVGNMIEKPVEATQAPKYKNGDTVYYQGKQYVVNSIYNDALAYDLETADGKPAFEEVPQSELSNQAPAPRSILDVAVEQVKKNEEKAAKVSIEKLVSENTIIAEDKKKQTIDRLNSVINKEIDNKDIVKTIEYLSDPLNEQTRSIFAQITGVKLPSTIKGSEATLREYVGLPAKEKLFLTKGEAKKAISENIGKNVFLQTGKRDWQDGRKSYPVNPSLVKIFSIDEKEVEFSYDLESNEPTHTINIDNVRDVVVDGVSTIGDTKLEGIVKDLFAPSGNKLPEQARPTIDFNNWKWEKASTNAIVIRPNTVGKPFTDEQFNTIMQWGEKNNFTPIRNSRNTRIEFVVDKLDNALVDYLDSVSVKAINDKKAADEKAKKDEAEKARKEELRNTVNSNPATSWINREFGEDAMNDYNKNALAKFLNGDTKTFEGQVNNKWADAIARLNALTEDGKGVDWVKLKKAYELAEVKPEVKNETKVSAAQAEADAALQDFLDAFNDLNSDNLGIVDNTAEKQAKMLVAGTKMVGAYTKLGLYKFADIMYQLGEKGIQITDDLLSAIKKAYGAFAAESEIDELDDMKTVRSFTLNDLQTKAPEKAVEEIQQLFNGQKKDLKPKTDNSAENVVSLTENKQRFINTVVGKLGNEKLNIVALRKIAEESGLVGIKDTTIQEYTELAIIMKAVTIVKQDISQDEKYKQIVELYEAQPTISMRSSERIEKQQYSTPIPLSFLAGEFVNGINPKSVLEPSAGNGMMVFNVDEQIVIANEIDEVRLENLRDQGFKEVTNQDGTLQFNIEPVDGVITNPPFGKSEARDYEGYKIAGLDEQMVVNALSSMKDDGRASIIIGGHTKYKENGSLAGERAFLNYLYDKYNVVDIINVDGSLYSKQGTTFPVRMILINGRRTGFEALQRRYAPLKQNAKSEPVKTFDELYKRTQENEKNLLHSGKTVQPNSGNGGQQTQDGNGIPISTGTTTTSKPSSGTGGQPNGTSNRPTTIRGNSSVSKPSGTINDAGRPTVQPIEGSGGQTISGSPTGNTRRIQTQDALQFLNRSSERIEPLEVDIEKEKTRYPARSKSEQIGSVVPTNVAQTINEILHKFTDIDAYVQTKLGYETKDELFNALSAEQIDSVALAIYQIENGKALIIGDMTGVGKGRQAAAIIRYAVLSGKKPIFITEGANLFSDIYRDLRDIGSADLNPFIFNSKSVKGDPSMTDENGVVIYTTPKDAVKRQILASGTLPEEYDYAVMTYSQLSGDAEKNGMSAKQSFFRSIASNNVLVLDESHNAGGEGNTGTFMTETLPTTKGVVFLSGTFAKRADNMPIYAMKTSMNEANMSETELIEAIKTGGIPLQEIMSKNLTETGQMVRRERDFTGVTIDWQTMTDKKEQHYKTFDGVITLFNQLIKFQEDYVDPVVEAMDDEVAGEQGAVGTRTGTAQLGISNQPFASKTFNLVRQMLFALKAQEVASEAIKELQAGRKPVIAIGNTMETFINEIGEVGTITDKHDYSLTLIRALTGLFRVTEVTANGDRIHRDIDKSIIGEEGLAKYAELEAAINNLSSGISISPIDVIKAELSKAGYSVGEMTGRTNELIFNEDGTATVSKRTNTEIKKLARDFNAGEIDVLILNRKASTGISLHASNKFKDQRKRVMLFAQNQLDVNTEVQMRGRIDRTGQVQRGAYRYIISPIPAEQRMIMMFKAKLKSLDANTTSSQKSKTNEIEVVDFLNKYGDEIIIEYLKENPDINIKMLDPFNMVEMNEEGLAELTTVAGAASKAAGRAALLTVKEQQAFYDEITEKYATLLDYLNDAGANDLEITTLPLKAETKAKHIVIQGQNNGNPFSEDSMRETVEVDVLKKPMSSKEVNEELQKLTEGKTAAEYRDALVAKITEYTDNQVAQETQKLQDEIGKKQEAFFAKAEKEADRGKLEGEARNEFMDAKRQDFDAMMELHTTTRTNAIRNRAQTILRTIKTLPAGRVVLIPNMLDIGTDTTYSEGMFLGFRMKDKITPSTVTAVFATLDGRRRIDVPLSKVPFMQAVYSQTNQNIRQIKATPENWDSMIPTRTRKTAYIITGNILQAYGDKNLRGQLVSYSTITGEIRQGILLPDKYKSDEQAMRVQVIQRINELRSGQTLADTSNNVSIKKEGDFGYSISVPLSKVRGGKYFLDAGLREFVEHKDFRQMSGQMVGYVPKSKIEEALRYLSDKFNISVDVEIKKVDDSDPQFQAISPIGFYSTVEKALEAINQERGTRDQFKAMLLNNGAKQAEMDWMGFDELPEKLTKADIQNWIDENRIEVEEVEKGITNENELERTDELHYNAEEELAKAQEALDRYLALEENYDLEDDTIYEDTGYSSMDEAYEARDEIRNDPDNYIYEDVTKREDSTKFSQYVLPGGENYKELLLTLPNAPEKTMGELEYMKSLNIGINDVSDFRSLTDERQNELMSDYRDYTQGIEESKRNAFKSIHFDEANILAHIRFNERTVNGERVLFIEEFQSDWAQKGKKEGFEQKETPKDIENKKKLSEEHARLRDKINSTEFNSLSEDEQNKIYSEYESIREQQREIRDKFSSTTPNMPFRKTDQWVNLAVRRMMRYAAENGFDRIAWTNGEQQYDRYPEQDSETETAKTRSSGMKAFYDAIVPSAMSKLGKPFGAKVEPISLNLKTNDIVDSVFERPNGTWGIAYEQGKFYDTKEQALAALESIRPSGTTQQSIPVTDSMKETAMAGLPLYHTGTTMKRTSKKEVAAMVEQLFKTGLTSEVRMVTPEEIAAVDRKAAQMLETKSGKIYGFVKGGIVYLNSTTPNLNTPIHEFGHLWIDAIEGSELYNRGAELVKNTPYWERVNADPNYSSLSEAARIKEAMAQAIGDKGEAVKRDLGLFARIKVWIADVWTRIGAKFGIQNLTPEQIQNLTFSDFVDVAVSELMSGEKLTEINNIENKLFEPVKRLFDTEYIINEKAEVKAISISEAIATNDIAIPDDVWEQTGTFYTTNPIYNVDNIDQAIYKLAGDLKPIYQSKHLLNFDRNDGVPSINIDNADVFSYGFNYHIEKFVSKLQRAKHLSTQAAQKVIDEVISDAAYAKDYYERYAKGQDVWRTEKTPSFQVGPEKPEFTGNLGEFAQQTTEYNEQQAERVERVSKMQQLQSLMDEKRKVVEQHKNKQISNAEYAQKMNDLWEKRQRILKGLPEPEPTDEDPDDNDPKPIRIIGQSVTEWATQVADWNYRQTIARALAKTASSVTGGLPPVDDDTDISGDMIRAELDQRLGGWFGRLAEAHQDNIRSVRIFQDMLKEKGTRISDFNNFYMQYTAIQGKNDAHLKDFGKRFMEAINANVLNIQKYTNYTYRGIENYVYLKHGIERNEYMRQAAAEEAVNEKLPKLTQEQIEGDIDGSLQDEYKAAYEQFLEEETAKVADKDYSGLFAVAAEIWAIQNDEAFNPKKKGDVARIQKMDEFKAERDAVIVEYIAKFEKTISETIIPTAVKGEQLTINGFWAAINASTHYSLDRLVSSGIESKEEVDDLKARYQYYVPLRGHEVEAEKIWQYEAPDNKNVVSKAIMQASGRESRAEHPFAYIIQMAQTSINKANRNQLNQTILRLARQDKSGLMSVSETWYLLTGTDPETGKEIWTESEPVYTDDHEYRASEVRAWNEKMTKLEGEGKARKFKKGLRIGGLFIKPKQKRQHAITVFEDGVAYQVYINGNPRVSQAINELNDKQTEIPIIPQLTRFCASMMTSRSPQFMLTNGARDLAFASTILPSKEGARYTGQFLKNYPVAMAVLANNATFDFGNNKAQYKKYLKEFEMNGGETGYSHLLELQDIQKELFKQQKGKNYLNPKTDIDAILSVIDAGNKVIENSTRLSVYITSRENGRSIERSVSDSKEVTLNFNRRGSGAMGASFIKSFFMFVNAGVQALANFGHVYKMHPIRMSATISSYAAVGFIMPMIISMIGGDDDEKEYMNMTDWERQTNLCLPTGSGFAKIPLPQEMRVFFKLGDEVYKLYSGRTEASETAIATLKSAADMIPISPLGTIASGEINDFGDLMKTLSPDAFRSIAELSANTNFMGGQIYDKYKAEKDDLPGYQKARLNRVGEARAPESIVGFTKWLDHLTGGNDVEKGGVSWNPDIVNHLAKSYLGGMYSLVAEGGKSFTKRFYTSNADIEEKNTTVKDYYKRTSEADELMRQEKGYWEQWQAGTITEAQYNAAVNQKAVDKAYEIHEYDKAITRIERILKTGELMPDDELYYKHTSDSLKREVIRIKLK